MRKPANLSNLLNRFDYNYDDDLELTQFQPPAEVFTEKELRSLTRSLKSLKFEILESDLAGVVIKGHPYDAYRDDWLDVYLEFNDDTTGREFLDWTWDVIKVTVPPEHLPYACEWLLGQVLLANIFVNDEWEDLDAFMEEFLLNDYEEEDIMMLCWYIERLEESGE